MTLFPRKSRCGPRRGWLVLAPWAMLWSGALAWSQPSVGPVPSDVREAFRLSDFYRQFISISGLPIVGSEKVSSAALLEAHWIIRHMMAGREDILQAMASNKVRLVVMAWNEFTTDVPEHSTLAPAVFWDRRARGLGATRQRPAVSCAEENLLGHPGDPYAQENILIHEFAHAVHQMGLNTLDPTFDRRLRQAFHDATNRALWQATYAGTNPSEYWAEGVQSWFDDNRQDDALHNHVNTRAELREYDRTLAALCAEVFGTNDWRYLKPMRRDAPGRVHLAALDASSLPRFQWRQHPVPANPRVLIQTERGDIEVELDAQRAPVTTANFLRYVLEGYYSNGLFHRTVRQNNQAGDAVKIEVIQAAAAASRTNELFAPIEIETTRQTGLSHLDGALSMARDGPDSARDQFFICVGPQPELDYGGKRNPDGQGFAAFGRVVRGMDVVRGIHQSTAAGQTLTPPIRIQRAVRNR